MEYKIYYAVTAIFGALAVVFYKRLGKSIVEARKKMFGRFFPDFAFGNGMVIATQTICLLGGILIVIVSIGKLFI